MASSKTLLLILLLSFPFFHLATSTDFLVGGQDGWAVPNKGDESFNDWASNNRFKVNDTVHFKYEKDSVLVVTEEEYKKCRAAHPLFFSNNGDTVYKLDRPGLFYFISGVTGHCERGQKLIIKVLELETPPAQSGNVTSQEPKKNNAAASQMPAIASNLIISMSLIGLLLLV